MDRTVIMQVEGRVRVWTSRSQKSDLYLTSDANLYTFLCRDHEFGEPKLRDCEGEEKVVVPYKLVGQENAGFGYLIFEDLTPQEQTVIRRRFPDNVLVSVDTIH